MSPWTKFALFAIAVAAATVLASFLSVPDRAALRDPPASPHRVSNLKAVCRWECNDYTIAKYGPICASNVQRCSYVRDENASD